jgi:hypothetical protein
VPTGHRHLAALVIARYTAGRRQRRVAVDVSRRRRARAVWLAITRTPAERAPGRRRGVARSGPRRVEVRASLEGCDQNRTVAKVPT